ncbi:hypothetical protein BDW22DRAFT_349868 [Trametopsis cervina]|nr:hypothetical protein BDW22DRAFT_349868 [Trametopsis cervina]
MISGSNMLEEKTDNEAHCTPRDSAVLNKQTEPSTDNKVTGDSSDSVPLQAAPQEDQGLSAKPSSALVELCESANHSKAHIVAIVDKSSGHEDLGTSAVKITSVDGGKLDPELIGKCTEADECTHDPVCSFSLPGIVIDSGSSLLKDDLPGRRSHSPEILQRKGEEAILLEPCWPISDDLPTILVTAPDDADPKPHLGDAAQAFSAEASTDRALEGTPEDRTPVENSNNSISDAYMRLTSAGAEQIPPCVHVTDEKNAFGDLDDPSRLPILAASPLLVLAENVDPSPVSSSGDLIRNESKVTPSSDAAPAAGCGLSSETIQADIHSSINLAPTLVSERSLSPELPMTPEFLKQYHVFALATAQPACPVNDYAIYGPADSDSGLSDSAGSPPASTDCTSPALASAKLPAHQEPVLDTDSVDSALTDHAADILSDNSALIDAAFTNDEDFTDHTIPQDPSATISISGPIDSHRDVEPASAELVYAYASVSELSASRSAEPCTPPNLETASTLLFSDKLDVTPDISSSANPVPSIEAEDSQILANDHEEQSVRLNPNEKIPVHSTQIRSNADGSAEDCTQPIQAPTHMGDEGEEQTLAEDDSTFCMSSLDALPPSSPPSSQTSLPDVSFEEVNLTNAASNPPASHSIGSGEYEASSHVDMDMDNMLYPSSPILASSQPRQSSPDRIFSSSPARILVDSPPSSPLLLPISDTKEDVVDDNTSLRAAPQPSDDRATVLGKRRLDEVPTTREVKKAVGTFMLIPS